MIQTKPKIVMPSVDLGGTKIAFAFFSVDEDRKIAREYPPTKVVKGKGKTDADKTLKLVAELIKKRTHEVEKKGWLVLKLVGMGAPGLYLEDKSVDPRSVPNIPGLAKIKPADVLEGMLGKAWKVYINNDGVVQAVASADALVRSPQYTRKWKKVVDGTGGKVIYFGPGTGFGAGKIFVRQSKHVEPMPGSQAFFDIVIRDNKTAEDLIGGNGVGKMAQTMERANIKRGKSVFLKFTEGYETWEKNSERSTEQQLSKITGEVVSKAFSSGEKEATIMAKEIFAQAGRDLAGLMIQLHRGTGRKSGLEWDKDDWKSVKGTSVFLVAGLLIKPTGKELILPSTRDALKKAGYAKKLVIVEMDQLPNTENMLGKIGIFGASLIVPKKEILDKKWEIFLVQGKNRINRYIGDLAKKIFLKKKRPVILAIDGYSGIDWQKSMSHIKQRLQEEGLNVTVVDFHLFYKSPKEIEEIVLPSMADDKTFGYIFKGKLEDLLDDERVNDLKEKLENYKKEKPGSPKVIVCFGPGAVCKPLRTLYDTVFYRDITREEITKRYKRGMVASLGARGKDESGKGQPAYLVGKRSHYIDFPVLDRHKKSIQKRIHFYIDDNLTRKPKLINQKILDEMISHLAQGPIQLKAFHDEGVWGGQWLKKIRNLPKEMINCAWAYELMAYHMSVKIPVSNSYIETSFANVLDRESDRIMGERVTSMFKGIWPIRVNYDDCWEGGDMAIQIHPDASYSKKHFNEPLHQDESYYIMASTPDAYVYLGLKDGIDLGEFKEAVREAETEGIPFDHRKYVNVVPAKEGDLFLIPAGTVHASGKGCVVLELSSTTDRYTFHFYDYLRPDLNGKLREIHSRHAFNMVHKYPHRTTSWVKDHLIQKPKLIRKGNDWTEHLLGTIKGLVFEVHRFEFATTIEDDTKGFPHVLSLAKGDGVIIQSQVFPERRFILNFSETVIVPASLGKYSIVNRSDKPCKVLKTLASTS
jgi:mannose-6-phosphate isomerase class I